MRQLSIVRLSFLKNHLRKAIAVVDPAPVGQHISIKTTTVENGTLSVTYKHVDETQLEYEE